MGENVPHECPISSSFLLPTASLALGTFVWPDKRPRAPVASVTGHREHSHLWPHFILKHHDVLFVIIHILQKGKTKTQG